MSEEDNWSKDDTKRAWQLVLKELRRQADDPGKRSYLTAEEKRDCLAELTWRGPNDERRKPGALKFKLSNLKSSMLYYILYGDSAGEERQKARKTGEKEVEINGKRRTRGLLHGAAVELEVIKDSIANHEVSVAMFLTQREPGNTHGQTEAQGPPTYRDIIKALVQAGRALCIVASDMVGGVPMPESEAMRAAINKAADLLADTEPKA